MVVGPTPSPSDSFIQRTAVLTDASPSRGRDIALRALDITFSALFLLVSLPLTVPIALVLLATSGLPLLYRGDRIGRGGRVFQMLKFRTLRRGAEERLGPYLGREPCGAHRRRPRGSAAGCARPSSTRSRSSGTSSAGT